ncbi:GGDEF domain-containing protein [Haloechinothrix salitolerans]|uniref:GGDEF domain-containing protein n=1 Tax=Haloechinothrix salitolerans TaxID=926830 RepID=A0ABW2C6Z5_9PSEU
MVDGPAAGAHSNDEEQPFDGGVTAVPDVDGAERGDGGSLDSAARTLRAKWRSASLAAGWRFPSDWGLPEVDTVCAALSADGPSDAAVSGLGRARAASGAGLDETLTDLAALHAVVADGNRHGGFVVPDIDTTPSRLVRVTALAWADVALDKYAHTEVTEPLTGLPSAAYLRTRLAEMYRGAARAGRCPTEEALLLTVSFDLAGMASWSRLAMMILAADALRSVFDGPETSAALGPSVLVVLADRGTDIAGQAVALRREITERMHADPQLDDVVSPAISLVRLRPTFEESCSLLQRIGRR